MTPTQHNIHTQLLIALARIGADTHLCGILASYGETLSDEMVLEELEAWNDLHASQGVFAQAFQSMN